MCKYTNKKQKLKIFNYRFNFNYNLNYNLNFNFRYEPPFTLHVSPVTHSWQFVTSVPRPNS